MPVAVQHADQLTLQKRRVGLKQALDTAGPFGAGDRTNASALTNQRIIRYRALQQEQVSAVLAQRECVLRSIVQQQLGLAQAAHIITGRKAQLYLKRYAAVGNFNLQRVA